jgi:hypothetical protein
MADESVLAELDPILAADTPPSKLWDAGSGEFNPNYDLARKLLAVPISQGHAEKQQSGRVAKALDAWIASELRRAGFPDDAVWPRAKEPRVLPADVAPIEEAVGTVLDRIAQLENLVATRIARAIKQGNTTVSAPSFTGVRSAVTNLLSTGKGKPLPGSSNAHILGRFYVKQVDVVISSWQHGPDVLVSTKTQFSSYQNNKNNRYEEAVGEAKNLRDRHPMAAMGFVYLVRTDVYDKPGSFAYLRDLLVRLRKPDGDFDATMLLAVDWDSATKTVKDVKSAASVLSAERFFKDLVLAVTTNSPVDQHVSVRDRLPEQAPPGGLPGEDDVYLDDTAEPD